MDAMQQRAERGEPGAGCTSNCPRAAGCPRVCLHSAPKVAPVCLECASPQAKPESMRETCNLIIAMRIAALANESGSRSGYQLTHSQPSSPRPLPVPSPLIVRRNKSQTCCGLCVASLWALAQINSLPHISTPSRPPRYTRPPSHRPLTGCICQHV